MGLGDVHQREHVVLGCGLEPAVGADPEQRDGVAALLHQHRQPVLLDPLHGVDELLDRELGVPLAHVSWEPAPRVVLDLDHDRARTLAEAHVREAPFGVERPVVGVVRVARGHQRDRLGHRVVGLHLAELAEQPRPLRGVAHEVDRHGHRLRAAAVARRRGGGRRGRLLGRLAGLRGRVVGVLGRRLVVVAAACDQQRRDRQQANRAARRVRTVMDSILRWDGCDWWELERVSGPFRLRAARHAHWRRRRALEVRRSTTSRRRLPLHASDDAQLESDQEDTLLLDDDGTRVDRRPAPRCLRTGPPS